MAKNSDTLHRVAATFQGGRDPDQDAVIQWLGTLPKDDKGQLRRSVLKYHLQRALLHYIHSGLASSQSVGVVPGAPATSPAPRAATPAPTPAPAVPVVPVFAAPVTPVAAVVAAAPAIAEHDNIPTLTDTLGAVPIAPAPASTGEGKKPGGLLRNRIKNSMNSGVNE